MSGPKLQARQEIPILQRGLLTIARRPEARAVLEQFLATEMGAECERVEPGEIEAYGQGLRTQASSRARCSAPTRCGWEACARRSRGWRMISPSVSA